MKTTRWFFCWLSILAFALSTSAQSNEKKRVAVTTTERVAFANGVSVHLKDSFGEVLVEGWERNEVEIQLTRGTQKHYELSEHAKEQRRLEKVKLVISNDGAGGLLIETKNIPFIMKNNFTLAYKVKVPQAIFLKVKHSLGEVRIANISGDIEATCKIGEIVLNLSEKERYDVDARVKIGEVSSEFGGQYKRQKLLGAKLVEAVNRSEPHKLYLRVGIGEVLLKKLAAAK